MSETHAIHSTLELSVTASLVAAVAPTGVVYTGTTLYRYDANKLCK